MNSVMNRKMFRPRGARNKLNAMGGIMASSAPLMQTVQRFNTGGSPLVRTSYVPGRGYVNYNPLNNPSVQRIAAQTEEAQRALRAGIPDMPATGLVKQAPVTRGFFNRLDQDVRRPIRSFVGGLFSPDPQGRTEIANSLRGIVGLDPVGVVTQPKVREGIQTITEDAPMTTQTNTSLADAENLSAPSYTIDDIVYQSGDTRAAFSDDAGIERNPGMMAQRDNINESPASLDDIKAAPLPSFLRTDKGGTKEDQLESTNIAESLLSARVSEEKPTTTDTPKKKKGITEQVSPAAVEIVQKTAQIDPKNIPKSQNLIKEIGDTISKQLDAGQFDEAEEAIAKATGIEERVENESSSRREMVEKERELIAEFLGIDPNEYKKDRGLALAEAAFKYMQTGDIGEAGQVLTARNREINAAQRKQTQAINAMAYKAVTGREETQADRDFRAQQAKFSRNHDFRMLGMKEAGAQRRLMQDMSFRAALNDSNNALKVQMKNSDLDALDKRLQADVLMLNSRLQTQVDIANATNATKVDIANATAEQANIRAMISGMGDGIRLAMLENSQKEAPLTGEELTNFVAERSKELAVQTDKFGPGTFGRVVTDNAALLLQNDSADNFGDAVSLVIQGIRSNPELASKYAADLQGIESPIPSYSTVPSDAEIEALVQQGITTISVGGKEKKITAVPDGA